MSCLLKLFLSRNLIANTIAIHIVPEVYLFYASLYYQKMQLLMKEQEAVLLFKKFFGKVIPPKLAGLIFSPQNFMFAILSFMHNNCYFIYAYIRTAT